MKFLTRRPIAHRGYHNKTEGVIENTLSAFKAAITHNYAIECDVQLSAEGEAVVFHDFTLERLTRTSGEVRRKTADELKAIIFKDTNDTILTLAELLELTNSKVPLIIEIKSRFDNDMTLTEQAVRICSKYSGEFALMSFDPTIIAHLAKIAPNLIRGIVSQNSYVGKDWLDLTSEQMRSMKELSHFKETNPHYLSWKVSDLPVASTTLFRAFNRPVICWTVRKEEDRKLASLYADQVTFEGYAA